MEAGTELSRNDADMGAPSDGPRDNSPEGDLRVDGAARDQRTNDAPVDVTDDRGTPGDSSIDVTVDSGPPGDSTVDRGNCPLECERCDGTVCHMTCPNGCTCPAGWECNINCGDNGCLGAVDCWAATGQMVQVGAPEAP